MEDFYTQKEVGQGSYSSKELLISGKVPFFGGWEGSIRQITSLALTW